MPDRRRFSLSDAEVLRLAEFARTIETHYSQLAGEFRPMDVEWAKDGKTGELFIVQARPETVHSSAGFVLERYKLGAHPGAAVLASGRSVGAKIGSGTARVILEARDMGQIKPGEVLVTDITDPGAERRKEADQGEKRSGERLLLSSVLLLLIGRLLCLQRRCEPPRDVLQHGRCRKEAVTSFSSNAVSNSCGLLLIIVPFFPAAPFFSSLPIPVVQTGSPS